MLYISKWKAAAILLTALICCLLAVPNFFPESTVKRWPEWAQRHIVLGLDLQGGSHILLEVDANDVRRQKLLALQDDVRRVLREARIGLTRAPVVRGNSVEVIIRESDLQQGLSLFGHPMQGIERHDYVEVLAERQQARVGDDKPRTRLGRATGGPCGRDHSPRRVDADRISGRRHSGHLVGQIPVATTDVEDPVPVCEDEARLGVLDHRPLQRAEPGVVLAAPVGHRYQLT